MRTPVFSKCLLVIAKSARILARMCVDIGYDVVAIDCYADADTRQMARQVFKVESLDWADVSPALLAVRQSGTVYGILYGSGLEAFPETLQYLQSHSRLFGNSAEVFRKVQDKPYFFGLMAELGVAHPPVSFVASSPGDGWIFKPCRSEGGVGIGRDRAGAGVDGYWQRFVDGQAMSVLFMSFVDRVEVIGFNRQWCAAPGPAGHFLFGGIASHAELPAAVRSQLTDAVNKLSAAYQLRGLNTLDFMAAASGAYVLEINPRISASAQLYGRELLLRHLAAFGGTEVSGTKVSGEPLAYQIVYAAKNLEIDADVDWPDWVVDRPVAGSIVGVGQPICSIIAGGKNSRQVAEQLLQRQAIVQTLLKLGC
ncbi:ATP-grasp domain-containing protein [Methylomonas koyamae]|uniref:ATP-grasp domain-containing protein n=1 Tax=Methylomonas koyamae TaxID=702114 RepID=A0AA91I4M6_9GAMM|nr:ATP-grasp domain-containing protein [Methylomonas koyamae]OAI24478.1 hypothetical protein A1356_15625 [Methylomonas koyamae]